MINVIPHHTVVDWDYSANITKSLDATTFVSSPSSLRMTTVVAGTQYTQILSRIAATQCIAQGEVRSWVKNLTEMEAARFHFRNQAALGSANLTNTYFWVIFRLTFQLLRVIAGVQVSIGSFSPVGWVNYAWNHARIIYWNGLNLSGNPALCSEAYLEIAGVWVKQGTTLYDTANQWKDSAINRSGIGGQVTSDQRLNFDDTEIWGSV